ncbi:MAG TPA: cytochrome b/b6 domain-containing protein, partial [Thermodesulfovibrionales bacterium]|nr:cytochrome b/b6 domain-containing protein [Thermodesulfovibrionales bacterium]
MSEKGLRQLEYSEIVLHWVNAGPFMILMLTGAFDIFGRLLSVSDQIMDLCVTIHKILGIIWITLILVSFFFVGVKLNIANFKRMFEWNLQDIRFLGMAFRSIVDKKVDVPESWKFNTSQKINSLWVFLYFIVFPITGFMMWLWGTMLIAWYIHAALFFAAVPTVLGHIVVTTFHPSGRVGLKGIFGRAPKFYVLQHDVVSVPGKSATGGGSEALPQFKKVMGGSFINIELLLVIAAIVFGIGGYVFFSGSKGLSKGFDSMISPNELSAAHRIKEINSCTQCHDYTGELRDEKCFKCHKMIKDRVEKKQGYHGTRKEACRDCHSEHPGLLGKIIKIDIKKYDHDTSSFKLVGAHKKVKCEECHKKVPRPNAEDDSAGGYWIGLKFKKCTNCHKDPHYGQFPEEGKYEKCGPCHNNDGWRGKNLVFDHQKDMKHRLEGKHAELKCWTCHPPDEKDANAAIKR